MDDKPFRFLKLHQGFGFYQTPTYSCCKCHNRSSKLYSRLYRWTVFPTVYASDGNETGPQMLELKRPKLFVTDEEIQERLAQETGADRLKALFKKDNLDHWHPDFLNSVSITKGAGFCTFLFMSVLGSIHGREEFIKSHRHVKFQTKFRAVRAYRDAIFVSGMKVGGLYALKVAMFTFVFFTSSTCVSAYFNKTSVYDFTFGGLMAGSLFRFNLGPKGMLAGGVIGGTIGSFAGLAITGMLHAIGETQDVKHNQLIHNQILQEKEAALISAGELTKEDITDMHVVN